MMNTTTNPTGAAMKNLVSMNGKQYRRVSYVPYLRSGGDWEWLYNGAWYSVRNYAIKCQLNSASKAAA